MKGYMTVLQKKKEKGDSTRIIALVDERRIEQIKSRFIHVKDWLYDTLTTLSQLLPVLA